MIQLSRILPPQKKYNTILNAMIADLHDKIMERGLDWLGVQGLSNVVYALAKMDYTHDPKARNIVHLSLHEENSVHLFRHDNAKPQHISNCLWACAIFDIKDSRSHFLLAELEQNVEWFVNEGTPQAISNCAWACATLGISSPQFFDQVDKRADWLFYHGSPQAVATFVWACATLGVKSPLIFALLGEEENANWLVNEGDAQHISNCAWACATLKIQSPNLFAALDRKAGWLFQRGTTHAISKCLWACATLQISVSPLLFTELNRNAQAFIENSSTMDIATSVWACATLGVHLPNLMSQLEQETSLHRLCVTDANARQISNCVWACATLGVEAPNLYSKLHPIVENLSTSTGDMQISCNICYGLVCGGRLLQDEKKVEMIRELWNVIIQQTSYNEMTVQELHQVAFIQIAAESQLIELEPMPASLESRIHALVPSIATSTGQDEVSRYLRDVGFAHDCKVSPLDTYPGFLSIDFASRNQMVAIEYDGPSRFNKNPQFFETSIRNGRTKAKTRLLEQLGWTVLRIDWKEWIPQLENKTGAEWLENRVRKVGAIP